MAGTPTRGGSVLSSTTPRGPQATGGGLTKVRLAEDRAGEVAPAGTVGAEVSAGRSRAPARGQSHTHWSPKSTGQIYRKGQTREFRTQHPGC